MDYPGITTYEPTLFGLLILLAIATVLTYPCTLMLILLDIVPSHRRSKSVFPDQSPPVVSKEIRDSDRPSASSIPIAADILPSGVILGQEYL